MTTLLRDETPPIPPTREPIGEGSSDADNGSLVLLLAFVGALFGLGLFRSWWIPGIVVGLLLMLFMHELGHYVTARASGMAVTEFFLGFGPKIWSFNRGETEYGVKAIPAGAYVRIIGMTNLDEIDPALEHRTYRSQPYWQRMMTICAGSAMHFLMALIALVVLFGGYGHQGFGSPPWEVNQVVEGSSAAALGVEVGDRIVEFEGENVETWDRFGEVVTTAGVGPVALVVERGDTQFELSGELGPRSGDVVESGFGMGVAADDPVRGWNVRFVVAGSAADQFGFEVDDVVVAVGGSDRPDQRTIADELIAAEGRTLSFVVDRFGSSVELDGTVSLDRSVPFSGFFGVGRGNVDLPDASWIEAPGRALSDFGFVAKQNIAGIINLVNPATYFGGDDDQAATRTEGNRIPLDRAEDADDGASNRPVSIIGIARLFAESESVDQVLLLFVIVNIFVGIFNLVPLLPLDGGHAAIATYERIRGLFSSEPHRVDAAKLIPVTWAVIMVLVGVGLWAAALDIFAWPAQ